MAGGRGRTEARGGSWALAAGGIALILLAGSWIVAARPPRALPAETGALAVSGLEAPLSIDRNRHGVPQVQAGSARDAFFGLGFCHGQDRLGQLLRLRRRAQGRAADELGAAALDADRVARLLDFRGLAERQWPNLPDAARDALAAYAAGVNARLDRVRAGEVPPPEGRVADTIEPWRPQDSLAVYKLFSWNLTASVEAGLVLHALVAELGAAEAGRFFPERLPGDTGPGRATSAAAAADWLAPGLRGLRLASGLDGYGVGSTAVVLGGAHTRSGRPVLVADSHTAPTIPAPFHLAHLRAPELDVAGLSLPGVPVFWSGRNRGLAWAGVHTGAVVTDLYLETLRREGSEYHDGRGWRPVEERTERLGVRDAEPVELVVRRTARGPLLDAARSPGDEAIAVAWTGARVAEPSGVAALLAVARAADGAALRAALADYREPVAAFVWADAAGGAGLQMAGWVPRRSLAARLLPLPGRASWYHWNERLPFEEMPARELDAGQGFVVAADQRFQTVSGAASIDSVWRPGVRARRLTRLLGAWSEQRPDLRRLLTLQADTALPRSRAVVEDALALAADRVPGREAAELAKLLSDWDGRSPPDSPGAAAYHTLLDTLARALLAEPLGDLYPRFLALPQADLEGLVHGILLDARAGGVDRWSQPGPVRRAVARSLRETWLGLSYRLGPDPRRWSWGALHRLRFTGARGEELGPFAYGGGPHALLAGGYSAARPFSVQVAATARLAVDLAAPDLLMAALAPGPSELSPHPHYRSGVEGWLAGRHALHATRELEIEENSVARLDLEPLEYGSLADTKTP